MEEYNRDKSGGVPIQRICAPGGAVNTSAKKWKFVAVKHIYFGGSAEDVLVGLISGEISSFASVIEAVKALAESEVKVRAVDGKGYSAIVVAVGNEKPTLTKKLAAVKAEMNKVSPSFSLNGEESEESEEE